MAPIRSTGFFSRKEINGRSSREFRWYQGQINLVSFVFILYKFLLLSAALLKTNCKKLLRNDFGKYHGIVLKRLNPLG